MEFIPRILYLPVFDKFSLVYPMDLVSGNEMGWSR